MVLISSAVGTRLRHRAQFVVFEFAKVRLLHQHAAEDAFQLQLAFRFQAARGQFQQAQIFLRGENFFGAISSKPGAAMHSTKSFRDFFGGRGVDHAIERQDATKCGDRIAWPALSDRHRAANPVPPVPQGLLCLTITAAGRLNSAARLRAASRSTRLL